MRTLTEKQQKQRQRSLEWQARCRWPMTALFLLDIFVSIFECIEKRSQWPFLLRFTLPPGVPIWHSAWENIFSVFVFTVVLVQWWVRVHNCRREQVAAEQLALQKAAKPPEGVWPPPPQQL